MKSQIQNIKNTEDSTLWSSLKAGDEKSFSILFEKYYSVLIRYGNSFSPFKEKVQDCVQDVFADVWIYRQSLSNSVVVKAYLLSSVRKRIARLQKRDYIFMKTSTTDSIEFLFDFSIEHQLISDEESALKVAHLNSFLNNLPARQKEALYLRYHQGLTVEQIAELLQINYQSANNLLHRALLQLRREWKGNLSLLLLLSATTF
ncbi:RNA polymerase sigma factor [Flavobacterium praedii]|uniref:RNA polymerase sigma factor n=1 Tax=Flavobacterium praedii TaxID=3002900 RepID=UPI0024820C28|nr:sigma-70 family RNA polymerase sigma factor [Flavobacterium praedii]